MRCCRCWHRYYIVYLWDIEYYQVSTTGWQFKLRGRLGQWLLQLGRQLVESERLNLKYRLRCTWRRWARWIKLRGRGWRCVSACIWCTFFTTHCNKRIVQRSRDVWLFSGSLIWCPGCKAGYLAKTKSQKRILFGYFPTTPTLIICFVALRKSLFDQIIIEFMS